MAEAQCPRCGTKVDQLQSVPAGVRAKIEEAGQEAVPPQVCANCFSQVVSAGAKGSIIAAREKAKENHKLMLWKSRVGMIRKARALMNEKAFSDAAVTYEKYIRVLEVVFDAKPGELTPQHFKESARTSELTILVSAYWDLMRIYDTSGNYGDRMKQTSTKLALFLRFTPLYPDIMRKADAFLKTSKNPAVIKGFIKSASEAKGGCFIATSAFESAFAPEVFLLREWRDQVLQNSFAGRAFIRAYYTCSPPVARFLDKIPWLKPLIRAGLRKFIDLAVRH